MKSKQIENAQFSLILIIHGGDNQIFVDSRNIALEFDREHKSVLRTLDNLIADGTISRHEFVPRTYKKRGKEYRCFQLNESGFLKAMPFIGGRKSHEGQKRLVDEFFKLRNQLDRQSKERETLAYQVARQSGKDSRAILTDSIQTYTEYARSQGSQNADKYFGIITSLIHKSVVYIEPQATQIRELMTAVQLKTLELAEINAAQVLDHGMNSQLPYKDIYRAIKSALAGLVPAKSSILGG